jgi:hypothetical protein
VIILQTDGGYSSAIFTRRLTALQKGESILTKLVHLKNEWYIPPIHIFSIPLYYSLVSNLTSKHFKENRRMADKIMQKVAAENAQKKNEKDEKLARNENEKEQKAKDESKIRK